MKPAQTSKRRGEDTKLLVLSANHETRHARVGELMEHLRAGDLLVVNRSATLPSSFRGYVQRSGEFVEIRLASFQGPDSKHLTDWKAFSFGAGDWTLLTEKRGPPPKIQNGDRIVFGSDLGMEILNVRFERLMDVRFMGGNIERGFYKYGKPIQYSYLTEPLAVWDQQTLFSGPPVSVEPPSASFPLTWDLVLRLKQNNVDIADILHGAGISSTGSAELDKLLPLAEWYDIPEPTTRKIAEAKARGANIVAVGTTVLRALESAWNGETIRAGAGTTMLKIMPESRLNVVTALVTGMHDVGASHMNIVETVCPIEHVRAAYREAEERGYRNHEYGDIAYLHCR